MIRNNILSLILQGLAGLALTVLVLGISMSDQTQTFFYQFFLLRWVLVALVFLIYYYLGKLLKKDLGILALVFSGLLPVLFGLASLGLAYLGLGQDLVSSQVGASLYRLPYDIFVMPSQYALHLLGIATTATSLLAQVFIGPAIMVLSNLISAVRLRRRKKQRRLRGNQDVQV